MQISVVLDTVFGLRGVTTVKVVGTEKELGFIDEQPGINKYTFLHPEHMDHSPYLLGRWFVCTLFYLG